MDSTAHIPLVSLALPQLAESRAVGGISCRAEPNPIGASSYLYKKKEARERAAAVSNGPEEEDMFPKRGYLASAEEAICIFALRVLGVQLGNFQFGHTFTFVVHRNAIVDVVHAFERARAGEAAVAAAASQLQTAMDLDAGSPSAVPTALSSSDDTSATTTAPTSSSPPRIPWPEWGPPITRWFNSDSIPTRWITTTAGQRCVLIADSAPDTGFPYVVLDFNAESVRRMKRWQKARTVREKERERRARERERERAMEEAREWAETSGSGARGGEGESEDEEAWYDVGADDGDGDEPVVHHTGMAIVDDEIFLEDGAPSMLGPEIVVEMMEQEEAPAVNGHGSVEGDLMNTDEDWTIEEEDENVSITPPAPEASTLSDTTAVTADSERAPISLERDPNNPLEGPDNSAARRIWCVTTSEMVEPAETFAERVEGRLPYVACASAQTYAFHGVLLDEERIIGIRVSDLPWICSIRCANSLFYIFWVPD